MAAAREQAARVLEAVGDGVMMVDPQGELRSGTAPRSSSPGAARRRGRLPADEVLRAGRRWRQIPVSEEAELARPVRAGRGGRQ
jgi:hypothetical protein